MAKKKVDKQKLPSLSNAEWEVMKPIWDKGPMAARDVYSEIPESCEWAYKTVKTLLSRLVSKGALDYEQIGNSYLYKPVYSRDELTRKEVHGFLDRVFDNCMSPVILQFVQKTKLTEKEIEKLRLILDKKETEIKSDGEGETK